MDAKHTVILDWDGTLVPALWPERPTEFMPGAVDAVLAMHHAGLKLTVCSARMNPYDPYTGVKIAPALVAIEKDYIRNTLDRMGLTFVDIWDRPGKPSGSAYVDDKAYRYSGTKGAWKAVANTIIMHLAEQEPVFPAFPYDLVEA
jgi:hypothetical protein